jgi:flagellar hook-associated protein 2
MGLSTSGISFSGLASGIDTSSMVEQLVALEQSKVAAVQKKQNQTQLRLTALGTLQSMLSTLSTSAKDLSKLTSFSKFTSNSSDDKVASISGTDEGLEGSVGVNVRQLATSLKVASKGFSDSTTATTASGTLTLSKSAAAIKTDPTKTTVDITIEAGDSLKDIAAKINSASGSGITASIMNFGNGDVRLMLNGADQGADGFSITEGSGGNVLSTLGLTNSGAKRTSDFDLRLATGGAATGAATLGSLYTGIGANNLAASDTIDLTFSVDGGASSTVAFSAASVGKTDLKDVTVDELTGWMNTQIGGAAAGFSTSLDSSGRIVATNTGTPAKTVDFSLAMGAGSTGTLKLGGSTSSTSWANVLQEGRNAFYMLNGQSVSSKSNEDSTTLVGATIKLKQVSETTTSEVSLTLEKDVDGIKATIQAFLDSFNKISDYIDEKTKTTVESKAGANGISTNSVTRGDLATDSSAQRIKQQLRDMITGEVKGLEGRTVYTSLASIGITTNSDTGDLTIDDDKFKKALNADFDGVRRLFANSGWTDNGAATVGGWTDSTKAGTYLLNPSTDVVDGKPGNRIGDILFSQSGNSSGLGVTAPTSIAGNVSVTFVRGLAGQIQQYINALTAFDGAYNSNKKTVQQQIDDYGKQADRAQTRVDSYRKNLVAQFSAMENAMLKIKNQSSAFLAQIGG